MSLSDDLKTDVAKIFKDSWDVTQGRVIPEPADVPFGNRGVEFDATVLYADLADSTGLVDIRKKEFAAEIYKTFLHCAGKIIRAENGVITAYDGDRIMAVFIGDSKNTSATRAGLKINYARTAIIDAAFIKQYGASDAKDYRVKHTVGIATSKVLVARTGVWGANDLVWVGSAANHAAKLTSLSADYPVRVTKAVYDNLHSTLKLPGMWESMTWTDMGGQTIYRTSWHTTF
jgi:class 3 adenylate cyclase